MTTEQTDKTTEKTVEEKTEKKEIAKKTPNRRPRRTSAKTKMPSGKAKATKGNDEESRTSPAKPATKKTTPKKKTGKTQIKKDGPQGEKAISQLKPSPRTKAGSPKQKSATAKSGKEKTSQKPSPRLKAPQKKSAPKSSIKLLINSDNPEECRVALLENDKVESFHVETVSRAQTKGNIYKGIITATEPNLQAAFVDIGEGKNGFLPFSDIHPEYYCKEVSPDTPWHRLNIKDVIRKGQEVLVEVVKEATGNKGANMTTYLSLPGRYLVLMPGSDSHGISRKIENETRRKELREIVNSVKIPEGIGFIIRTASKDITKTALVKDIRYLIKLWKEIKKRGQKQMAPSLIFKEEGVITRFLRDHFASDVQEILVDNKEIHEQIQTFLQLLPAKQRNATVKLHTGSRPLFTHYHIEKQVEQMYQPTVSLRSGGSIVINPTEALVAIDVNSGRTSKDKNFEETIFLTNTEAAEELVRQLRLRDLGGLIVVDFIDMRDKKHIRAVEKLVKAGLKRDKAKTDTSQISRFGLMQISRQRLGPPLQKGSYVACEYCQGHGVIRSVETMALVHLRYIQNGAIKKSTEKIICQLPPAVAQYLLNQKRADIFDLEKKYEVKIQVEIDSKMAPFESKISVF